MNEYEKAKEMLERWKQHDIENHYYKGVPNYPTNGGFVRAVQAELERSYEKAVTNTLDAKQTRINGNEILLRVMQNLIVGTDYTPTELLEIMLGISITKEDK